jgi:hypothetical protein
MMLPISVDRIVTKYLKEFNNPEIYSDDIDKEFTGYSVCVGSD